MLASEEEGKLGLSESEWVVGIVAGNKGILFWLLHWRQVFCWKWRGGGEVGGRGRMQMMRNCCMDNGENNKHRKHRRHIDQERASDFY